MVVALRPDLAVVLQSRLAYDMEVLADRPLMYLRLGESSGNPRDLTGLNHVTTITGTPTYLQTGALLGDGDRAVAFNGTDGSFQAPDFAAASIGTTGVLTIEFWDKAAISEEGCPIAKTAAGQYEWAITTNPTNPYSYYAQGWVLAGTGIFTSAASGTVTYGVWHHVVCVLDEPNHTVSWFIDGVAAGVDATAWTGSSANGTAPVSIAQRGDGASWAFYNATLDEVALYNYALPLARIKAHYQAAGY